MRKLTSVLAAAFIAGGASFAMAQTGTGASGTSASGAEPATPRQNMVRPTPNSPPMNRRGDEMAPLQGQAQTQTQFNTGQSQFNTGGAGQSDVGMTPRKSSKVKMTGQKQRKPKKDM